MLVCTALTQRTTQSPPWPVRPRPINGEATLGYMMRVAYSNGYESLRQLHPTVNSFNAFCEGVRLTLSESRTLFGPHPSYWGSNELSPGLVVADFNHHFMRWCPMCLGESPYLRGKWTLKLCCVCTRHSVHLFDRCPVCGLAQGIERANFKRCSCGALLAAAAPLNAPPSLVRVTQAIEASIFGGSRPSVLPRLAPHEWLRLVRYLGQFSETIQPARPGKISNLHKLEKATFLITGISHLIDNWPINFHALLGAIQRKAEASPSIRRAFGALYRVLYVDLRCESFQFLRDEFEHYLLVHWWGVVCKRNRSLNNQTVVQHPRITLRQAAHQVGVPPSTVRRYIQAELIPSDHFVFPSGRKTRSIHRNDLMQLAKLADDCLTMSESASRLALPERRVRELIDGGVIVPVVSRVHDNAATWQIPSKAVEALCFVGEVKIDASPSITVGKLVQFWRLLEGEFVALVKAIVNKHLVTLSIHSCPVPLGNVVVNAEIARTWLATHRRIGMRTMTIDQAARKIGLKQQVVYDLARRGLLATVKDQSRGSRVEQDKLEAFCATHISLAEFSRKMKHSSKWVLQHMQVTPITGPTVDGGRQYFLRRSDVCHLEEIRKEG